MAYRALYRKYRPKGFSDIVGQPALVQALRTQVGAQRVSHAYLFSGPRGTGKTSVARVLARSINCEHPADGEACGVCRPCLELLSETNMDVVEIDAASNNSVDKVREMLENVKYMPAIGRFRVYIIDEVHMLSTSAFNALLKTLEEPPAHIVFILATTEPQKLPATVLSRCQQFQFRRIGGAQMTELLRDVLKREGGEAEDAALMRIARAADGGMRDALSLLDQCLSAGELVTAETVAALLGSADSDGIFHACEAILTGDAGGAIDALDDFLSAGGDCKVFADDLCRHLRDLVVARYAKDSADVLDVTQEEAERLRKQAKAHAVGDILRALNELVELEGPLRYAVNPRIPVELALLRCCRQEKTGDYEVLLTRVERLEAALAQAAAQPTDREPERMMPAAPTQTAPQAQRTPMDDLPPWEEPVQATPAQPSKPSQKPQTQLTPTDDLPPWEEPAQAAPGKPQTAQPDQSPEKIQVQRPHPASVDDLPPWEVPPPTEEFRASGAPVDDLPPWEAPPPFEEPTRGAAPQPQPPRAQPAAPAPGNRPTAGSSLARAAEIAAGMPAQPQQQEAPSNAARLWKSIVDGMSRRNLPHLVGFASKGKGQRYDGETLVVSFTQDDSGSAEMLSDEHRMARLKEVASDVCGRPVNVEFEVSLWSPAEQQFIEQSRAALPANTNISIEKD